MTRQTINFETSSTTKPFIKVEIKPNCWICGKEIKEGELFVSTLKKDRIIFTTLTAEKSRNSMAEWLNLGFSELKLTA